MKTKFPRLLTGLDDPFLSTSPPEENVPLFPYRNTRFVIDRFPWSVHGYSRYKNKRAIYANVHILCTKHKSYSGHCSRSPIFAPFSAKAIDKRNGIVRKTAVTPLTSTNSTYMTMHKNPTLLHFFHRAYTMSLCPGEIVFVSLVFKRHGSVGARDYANNLGQLFVVI